MGRGRSNWTKLKESVDALSEVYMEDWHNTHPEDYYSKIGNNNLLRQRIEKSAWFAKNFFGVRRIGDLKSRGIKDRLNDALDKVNNDDAWESPAEALFKFAQEVEFGDIDPLGPYGYLNTTNPKAPLAQPLNDLHRLRDQEYYRLVANFYLALVRHFIGSRWEKELKKLYKVNKLSYRRLRTDRGNKLTGNKYHEFRMKLEGHQLLISAAPDDDELWEANLRDGAKPL